MSDETDKRAWGYHPKEGAKIFEDGALPDGWSDTPEGMSEPAVEAEGPTAKEALQAEAAELGVQVDRRWSVDRLQEEIDLVKAEQDGDSA